METNFSYLGQQNRYQYPPFTQGCNEGYSQFITRAEGFKFTTEPNTPLRKMVIDTMDERLGLFRKKCHSFSTSSSEGPVDTNQYFFSRTPDTSKQGSSQNIDYTSQALSVPLETQNCHRETGDKPKKTVFQRLLNFLTRCFMPCINVKP